MTPTRPRLPWLVRLAAHTVAPAYRDEIVADLTDERDRLGRSSAWLAWQLVRSARDSRRELRRSSSDPHDTLMADSGSRARLLLPSVQDLRLAVRAVWKGRVSTAAILLTMAVAIGGTTAMFSVVHAVLIEPLPYANPDRLVRVWERHVPRNRGRNVVSPANFTEWRSRSTTLQDLAAVSPRPIALTGDGPPEQAAGAAVTWNLFAVLGVDPVLGRSFVESDGVTNAEPVVLVGWRVWQRRYRGDPSLVGRSISVNDRAARVVGVLPEGFRLLGSDIDVWLAFTTSDAWRVPRGRSLEVLGRLRPGVTLDEANAEMDTIAVALEKQWPDFDAGWRVEVVDAREDLVGDLTRPLVLLLVAVAVVLLVGCANAANLLLARAADRRREFEVRTALGATRGRLLRQLALEGLVLGGAGTLAGLVVAGLTLRAITGLAGSAFGVPRLENAELNMTVLTAALGLLSLATLAFGLVPGWLATRPAAGSVLGGTTRAWTGGRAERRVRTALVVAQVAFAVLLVISAGLVGRSLLKLVAVDPGFDARRVLTLTVAPPAARYSSDEQVQFFERAAEALRVLPGIETVGAITWIPFGGPGGGTSFDVDGRVPQTAANRPVADIRPVDADYFATMRIPLRRGRYFTRDEVRNGARVAIVNEDLVRRLFPDEDPIGKRLQVNWNEGLDEIVGVVADVKISGLASETRSQIYFPQGTANVGFVTYVMRASVDEQSLADTAVSAIQALDPNLPIRDVRPMQALIDASVAAPEVALWLVGAFGALALMLALIGVAGLEAASVAARLPEFGIRLALGATPSAIRGLMLGQASRLIGLGLAIGLAASLGVSRLVASLLYDTPAVDPPTYLATAAAVAALGLAACTAAVRRATAVNPAETLRG